MATAETPVSATSSATYATVTNSPQESTDIKLSAIQGNLCDLSAIFDNLGQHIGQIALLGGDLGEMPSKIEKIRSGMKDQDTIHDKKMQEIREQLAATLQSHVEEQLKTQVEKAIDGQIDELVKKRVANQLKKYAPQDLQEKVAEQRRILGGLQVELHNAESRRENALLKVEGPNDTLHTIRKPNGEISTFFPKTLTVMSELPAEIAKELLQEYGMEPTEPDSREANINRFMYFCGVPYQMVPNAAAG